MVLIVLRLVFLIVSTGLAVAMTRSGPLQGHSEWVTWAVFGGTLSLAVLIIAADMAARRKNLAAITSVYFGLLIGLFLTYVVGLALIPLPLTDTVRDAVQILLGAAMCYVCISLLLQTKDDFRFIIPYVEFAKEVKGRRPYLLDTSVIIDGRIADVVETRIFDTQLIIPRFVIGELQAIADSGERLRRSRGRRGLDILNRLRGNADVDLVIYDRELPEFAGQPVDLKLVLLAKHLSGKLVTNDYNLNKVARLHDVGVINLNDLANALKPVFLPGEHLDIRLVKVGEEPGQGVGYLDDGTMVVVEAGRDHVHQTVTISVTSVLQTSAGRMIFGRFESLRQNGKG
jgi:uncharacterized protein YacL